jgi:hypothetical protein
MKNRPYDRYDDSVDGKIDFFVCIMCDWGRSLGKNRRTMCDKKIGSNIFIIGKFCNSSIHFVNMYGRNGHNQFDIT